MHNLEELIAQWRQKTVATYRVPPDTLDELENHLRETMEELVRSGLTEAEAFQGAVKRLGAMPAIVSEFQKLDRATWLPVKWVIAAGVLVALAMALLLTYRLVAGRSSILLASHVFTVALGFATTLLVGVLGICFVGQRCFSDFSLLRMRAIPRVTFILGSVAAALSAVGIILAMVWAKAEWGRYWAWDAKETGAFFIFVWQLCFLFAHRFDRGRARGVLVMSVLGNIVIGLGWFGANLISNGLHAYGTRNYSLLLLAAGVFHLAFFLIGFAPAGWLRPRRIS